MFPKLTFRNPKLFTILGILIVGYAFFSLSQTLWQNYRMTNQIETLKDDIAILEERKKELESLNAYYKTQSYQEKEARRRLGYQKPGEHVLIVTPAKEVTKEETNQKEEKSNWQAWWNFFFK